MIVDENRFKGWLIAGVKTPDVEELIGTCRVLADRERGTGSQLDLEFNNTILLLWQLDQVRRTGEYHPDVLEEISHYMSKTDIRNCFTISSPAHDPFHDLKHHSQRMLASQALALPIMRSDYQKPFQAPQDASYANFIIGLDAVLENDEYHNDLKNLLVQNVQRISLFSAVSDRADFKDYFDQLSNSNAKIKNGPVSPNELFLCVIFYMMHSGMMVMLDEEAVENAPEFNFEQNPFNQVHQLLAIGLLPILCDLIEYLNKQQSDLNKEGLFLREISDSHAEELAAIAETHVMTPERLVALTQYYYAHNQHKMGGSAEFLSIIEQMQFVLGLCIYSNMTSQPNISNDPVFQELLAQKFQEKTAELVAFDIKVPPLEQVASKYAAAIDQQETGKPQKAARMKEKFHTHRASIPVGMREVVLLHYQEREELREMRKKLFGPQKEAFLKSVATENATELAALGLSNLQIAKMKADGKIPEGSGLTVEHIIDREHGGTNHADNFIVLPREINQQKDKLKQKQLRAYGDAADKGCWIISWVPKKREDGTYPRVWPANTHEDFRAELQMQAQNFTPNQS